MVIGSNKKINQITKDMLHSLYEMKDLGEITSYVGLDIERDRNNRTLTISQERYITSLLNKFGAKSLAKYVTPAGKEKLERYMGLASTEEVQHYQQIVGSINYLAIGTRPDISYALSLVSPFMQNPGPAHFQAVNRILSYIYFTATKKIHFSGLLKPTGFCDANWGGNNPKTIGIKPRSQYGYVFKAGGGAISWRAPKTKTSVLSSFAAECIALADAVGTGYWFSQILKNLAVNSKLITIYADNEASIKAIKSPIHDISKHVDAALHLENTNIESITQNTNISFWVIRDYIENGIIEVKHIPGRENCADIFTKPLFGPAIDKCARGMGVY
jgi:hypothetical protein